MIGGSVTTTGDALAQLDRAMANLETSPVHLLQQLGESAVRDMLNNILESRFPDGRPYPPLKQPDRGQIRWGKIESMWEEDKGSAARYTTIAHPFSGVPLIQSSRMFQSIHYEVRAESVFMNTVWAGPTYDAAPYFPYQNEGAPRAHIPARTFIGLRAETILGWDTLVYQHVYQAFRSAA